MRASRSNLRKTVADARSRIVRGWVGSVGLALLVLGLAAGPAWAQVPQDVTFRGRLVDGVGSPQSGPVNLELRVFDDETTGSQLYAESHTGVPLDAIGAFSVQLGAGTLPSGTFDAALFAEQSKERSRRLRRLPRQAIDQPRQQTGRSEPQRTKKTRFEIAGRSETLIAR